GQLQAEAPAVTRVGGEFDEETAPAMTGHKARKAHPLPKRFTTHRADCLPRPGDKRPPQQGATYRSGFRYPSTRLLRIAAQSCCEEAVATASSAPMTGQDAQPSFRRQRFFESRRFRRRNR